MHRENLIKKVHLIISLIIVIPVAIVMGFKSGVLFNVHMNTIDEFNVFKATMGLYLGFSVLWILGLLIENFLFAALLSNVVFMLGLGFGRLVSLVIDGVPSFLFVFGTFGELFLGVYGLWVLKRNQN